MMTPAQEIILQRANDNYSNSPLKVTDVLQDQCWHGKRCFILGGGESLKGFNFSQLDKELTIGINKSFIHYDSSLLFFSDSNFYDAYVKNQECESKWMQFKSPKISIAPVEIGKIFHDVYVARKSCHLELPHSILDGINVWNNSGFGALVLAHLLGANPIYLLGFDMKCVNTTHWHEGYDQELDRQNAKLHTFMLPFNMTSQEFKHRSVHIVNLNPDSALTCYHKSTLEKVL